MAGSFATEMPVLLSPAAELTTLVAESIDALGVSVSNLAAYLEAPYGLNEESRAGLLAALRKLKNLLIGCPARKRALMKHRAPLIAQIAGLIASDSDIDDVPIRLECMVILGCLAIGCSTTAEAIVLRNARMPIVLVQWLMENIPAPSSDSTPLILAACFRSLRSYFDIPGSISLDILEVQHLCKFTTILFGQTDRNVNLSTAAESLAKILTRCCDEIPPVYQDILCSPELYLGAGIDEVQKGLLGCEVIGNGLLHVLVLLATRKNLKDSVLCALDAISAICRKNPSAISILLKVDVTKRLYGMEAISFVISLIRDDRPEVRLKAATCIAQLHATGLPKDFTSKIRIVCLPALVSLVEGAYGIETEACLVLAKMLSNSESMQRALTEFDGVSKLVDVLRITMEEDLARPDESSSRLEAILLALAAGCSVCDRARKIVTKCNAVPLVTRALSNHSCKVAAAACRCILSISRSARNLRTYVQDCSIADPLIKVRVVEFDSTLCIWGVDGYRNKRHLTLLLVLAVVAQLLQSESTSVLEAATSAICNMVLDIAPMKKQILESGTTKRIAELVRHDSPEVSLNSLWALRNMVYNSDQETKLEVLRHLTFEFFVGLLRSPCFPLQEQAFNLLRNITGGQEEDLVIVFNGFGTDRLVKIIEQAIEEGPPEITLQARFVLINIVTGNEEQKQALMNNHKIIGQLRSGLTSDRTETRLTSVWTIGNIMWKNSDNANSPERCTELRRMGFLESVKNLLADEDMDVRERAETAMKGLRV